GTVCVVGKMRDLILQLSKSSIYSTKPTEGRVDYAAWVNDKGEVYSVDKTGDEVFFRETEVAIKKCKFVPGHPGVYRDTIKFSLVKP
ncbi:hypothetical protein VBQ65_23290, partial [Klebsiella pneumoniae]|nr:hypothetical protein [Klebsiella pneumoniae]